MLLGVPEHLKITSGGDAMDLGSFSELSGVAAMTRIELGHFLSLVLPHGGELEDIIKGLPHSSDNSYMNPAMIATSSSLGPVAQTRPIDDPERWGFLRELEQHPQTLRDDFMEGMDSCGDLACTSVKGIGLLFLLVSIAGFRMVRRLFGGRRRH